MKNSKGTSCTVFSIPRSGTFATLKMLGLMGLEEYFPENQIRGGIGPTNMFHMPATGYFQYGGHMVLDFATLGGFRRSKGKAILITRDLRDVAVSHAFFAIDKLRKEKKDLDFYPHPIFFTGNLDEILTYIIELLPYEYNTRIGWKNIGGVYHLTYERLFLETSDEIDRISSFLDIDLSDEDKEYCLENFPPNKGWKTPKHFYFRKGIVGDWRNHFTEKHKKLFKQVLGQVLIDEGYEKDLNW